MKNQHIYIDKGRLVARKNIGLAANLKFIEYSDKKISSEKEHFFYIMDFSSDAARLKRIVENGVQCTIIPAMSIGDIVSFSGDKPEIKLEHLLSKGEDAAVRYLKQVPPYWAALKLAACFMTKYICRADSYVFHSCVKEIKKTFGVHATTAFGNYFKDESGVYLIGNSGVTRVINSDIQSVSMWAECGSVGQTGITLHTKKFGDISIGPSDTLFNVKSRNCGLKISSLDELSDSIDYFFDNRNRIVMPGYNNGSIVYPGDTRDGTSAYTVPGFSGVHYVKPKGKVFISDEVVHVLSKIIDIMSGKRCYAFDCSNGNSLHVIRSAMELLGYEGFSVGWRGASFADRVQSSFRASNFFPQFVIVPKITKEILSAAVVSMAGSGGSSTPIVVVSVLGSDVSSDSVVKVDDGDPCPCLLGYSSIMYDSISFWYKNGRSNVMEVVNEFRVRS